MNQLVDNTAEINKQIDLLASIEPTGINFLTCYLDTQGDRRQALQTFRQLQLSYRNRLNAKQKNDFDLAVKMVDVYLENLDSKVKSVAIFCRGILGGQFFLPVPLSEPSDNLLVFQNTPSISLLLDMQQHDHGSNTGQGWLVYLQHNPLEAKGKKRALSDQHIEKDENSYSIADNREFWPAGPPLALQQQTGHPKTSLDLVA